MFSKYFTHSFIYSLNQLFTHSHWLQPALLLGLEFCTKSKAFMVLNSYIYSRFLLLVYHHSCLLRLLHINTASTKVHKHHLMMHPNMLLSYIYVSFLKGKYCNYHTWKWGVPFQTKNSVRSLSDYNAVPKLCSEAIAWVLANCHRQGRGRNWAHRDTLVAPWSKHCSCCSWQKDTSRDNTILSIVKKSGLYSYLLSSYTCL